MLYNEYVKVARGKPCINWPGEIKNFIGEAKFSLSEGKKIPGSGFTGSVTERCLVGCV